VAVLAVVLLRHIPRTPPTREPVEPEAATTR
jgi:hypothetical protein